MAPRRPHHSSHVALIRPAARFSQRTHVPSRYLPPLDGSGQTSKASNFHPERRTRQARCLQYWHGPSPTRDTQHGLPKGVFCLQPIPCVKHPYPMLGLCHLQRSLWARSAEGKLPLYLPQSFSHSQTGLWASYLAFLWHPRMLRTTFLMNTS